MTWMETTLGAHIELVSGPAFKSAYFTDDPSDVPLVKGDNLGQGEIHWSQSKYWPKRLAEEYDRFRLSPGDVILAMDRPWVTAGLKYAWIKHGDPDALLVQRVARIRGTNGVTSDFIRYIVASKTFSDYIQGIMGGTNVPHISGEQIRAFKMRVPEPDVQDRIVDVLTTYDKLIANNRRRIELLDRSARELFKEWFVRLRYPGHEHDVVVDGVPAEWSAGDLDSFCDRITDGSHWSPESVETGYAMSSVKDMGDWFLDTRSSRRISEIDYRALVANDCKPLVGDVLVSKDGANLNKNVLLTSEEVDLVVLSSIAIIRPSSRVNPEFLFALLRSTEVSERIRSRVSGVAIPRIVLKDFRRVPVCLPPRSMQNEWVEVAGPLHQLCRQLTKQNVVLSQARDLLLPRLMDGRISV